MELRHHDWGDVRTMPTVVPFSTLAHRRSLDDRTSLLGCAVVPPCVAFVYDALTRELAYDDRPGARFQITLNHFACKNASLMGRRSVVDVVEVLSELDADTVVQTMGRWGTPTSTHLGAARSSRRGIQNYAI